MKRPSLKAAIDWIAENDEPTGADESEASDLISVALTADLFGISTEAVAKKVVAYRRKRDAAK